VSAIKIGKARSSFVKVHGQTIFNATEFAFGRHSEQTCDVRPDTNEERALSGQSYSS
jgi:hypothetical protein